MHKELLTEEQLIDAAQVQGCEEITHWKLERWHKMDVIPRPLVESLGYPKGTRSLYPAYTLNSVLAVCRMLKSTRNFARIRFQLWQEGYPIALPLLKSTLRELVPQLQWNIPRGEAKKYAAVERLLNTLLQAMKGRLSRTLSQQFGKKLENLHSFLEIQLQLMYGIPVIFEPSHHQDELSTSDILRQGLGVENWGFLPRDLTATFQHFSNERVLSLAHMNTTLEQASEEDMRHADERRELFALLLECFEFMGILPKLVRLLRRDASSPSFQALSLVFLLHLEKCGYTDNINEILKVLQVQIPRFRAFQVFAETLQQELPTIAKAIGPPQQIWQQLKTLSEAEREQYLLQKQEQVREIYLHHQRELDVFWQHHLDIKNALEVGDVASQ